MNFCRQEQGFTLVEVLITAVLMVVLAVPMVETCLQISRLVREGGTKTTAVNLAQGQLEQLKALSWEELDELQGQGSQHSQVLAVGQTFWLCQYQISSDDPIGGPGAIKQIAIQVYRLEGAEGNGPYLEATLHAFIGRY